MVWNIVRTRCLVRGRVSQGSWEREDSLCIASQRASSREDESECWWEVEQEQKENSLPMRFYQRGREVQGSNPDYKQGRPSKPPLKPSQILTTYIYIYKPFLSLSLPSFRHIYIYICISWQAPSLAPPPQPWPTMDETQRKDRRNQNQKAAAKTEK